MKLTGKSFLTLLDYEPGDIRYLIESAKALKEKKHSGKRDELLRGKNLVMFFMKTSTCIRCAFEVAAYDEGAKVVDLTNSQAGVKESIADTAKLLGRMFDGIVYRGFKQKNLEHFAVNCGVPVYNALTDEYHPGQALADAFTIIENTNKNTNEIKVVYMGDARNNVANSLMIICAKLGMNYTAIAPKSLFPDEALSQAMKGEAIRNGGSITLTEDIGEVAGADAVYTDVWVSLGEEDKFEERIRLLNKYQVNEKIMEMTGNERAIFMHCLPAFHDRNTSVGREVYEKYGLKEMEVTDGVFTGKYSRVYDQAENCIHAVKAVLLATLI